MTLLGFTGGTTSITDVFLFVGIPIISIIVIGYLIVLAFRFLDRINKNKRA